MPIEPVTIPAYAADTLGETITVHAPTEWHDRVRALGVHACYGPNYLRSVVHHLGDVDQRCRGGYLAIGLASLVAAEARAARGW